MNQFDSDIDKFIESKPPEVKKHDPIDDAIKAVMSNKKSMFKLNEKKAEPEQPDQYSQYYKVAKRERIPVEMVKRNWDFYGKKRVEYGKLVDEFPKTARFLNDPEKLKLFKDDVDTFNNLEGLTSQPKGLKEGLAGGVEQGFQNLESSYIATGIIMGAIDPDVGADLLAENNKRLQEIELNKPTFLKEFDKKIAVEGEEVNAAASQFMQGFTDIKKDKTLEGLKNISVGGIKTLAEGADFVGEYLFNPRATAVGITQNLANALPSLIGAGAGAGIGTATPLPGGAIIGATAGTFTGSVMTEFGSQIVSDLQESGVNLGDKVAVSKAFRDPVFLEKAKSRALKKGITTAAFDAMFTALSGGFLKGLKGAKFTTKAKAIGKELGVQSLGEVVSEAVGQAAREGDIAKVDVAESLQEGILSFGQSAGDVVIGAGAKNVKLSKNNLVNLKEGFTSIKESIKTLEFGATMRKAQEMLKGSKSLERAPEIVAQHIDNITDASKVYFQSDDWEGLFPDNPIEKADELLPGGREQYLESKETGVPMEVKSGEYLTNMAQKDETVSSIMRQEPDGLTESEARLALEDVENKINEVAKEAETQLETEKKNQESFEAVQENVAKQFKDLGFNQSTTDAYVAAMEPMRVMAERSGIDPKTLFDRYNLKIQEKVEDGQKIVTYNQKEKGRIKISPKRDITIELFRDADKSTFLHESGHLFLEVFKDLASDINAPKDVVEDFNTILQELGVTRGEDIKTEQHEKFARMYESYLAEGKAPSTRLQKAFRKFRVFMTALYGKLLKQKVKLKPEIREVMDRMFATQEEINELMEEQFIAADDVEQYIDALGLNEKDTKKLLDAHREARHQVEEELISKEVKFLNKVENKKFKAAEKEIREQVTVEANEIRVYKGFDTLKAQGKVNTKELRSIIGEDKYKALPKGITSPKGMPVAMAQDMVGYNSITEFVDELINSPSKQQFIEAHTRVRVRERLGFEKPYEAKRAEAQEVVSEKISNYKKLELDMMLKNAKPEIKKAIERVARRLPKDKEIAARAKTRVANTLMKNLKPSVFSKMENKARKQAISSLLKGDFEAAYEAKYRERVNHEMYKEARKLEVEFNKFERKYKKLFSRKEESLAKNYELNYINLARGILNDFGIIPMSERREARVNEYMNTLRKADPVGFERVEAVNDLLSGIAAREKKELSLSEYEEIVETVNAITEVARDEKKVDTVKGRKDREEVINEFLKRSSKIKKADITDVRSKWNKAKQLMLDSAASLTRVEHFINLLDDGDINGPLRTAVFDPLKDAQVNYDESRLESIKEISDIIREDFKGVFENKTEILLDNYFPNQRGEKVRQQEILVMLLNSGNQSNLEKLLVGRGWGDLDVEGNLDTTKYDAFINRMVDQGMINKEMLEGVQKIWDLYETKKPEIQKTYKAITGRFMGEIEAQAFKVPALDVTLKGGYYPAITDGVRVAEAAKRENETAFEMNKMQFTYAAVPKGMTKERVANYRKALSLDFLNVKSTLDSSIRLITLGEAVHNAQKILKNQQFRDQVHSIIPNSPDIVFDGWLARMSYQRTMEPAKTESGRFWSKIALVLNQSASVQIMSGNTLNTIEQLTEIVKYVPEFGGYKNAGKSLMTSYKSALSRPIEFINQVKEMSPFMKERLENTQRKVMDDYTDLTIPKSEVGRVLKSVTEPIKQHAFFMQQMATYATEPVLWKAKFNEGLSKGMTDADATRLADSMISRIGGGISPLTVSAKESGPTLQKLLMPFTSFFINGMNQVIYAKDKPMTYFYTVALTSITGNLLRVAFKGSFDEEDDGYVDDAFDTLALSQIRFLAAGFPIASQALRLTEGFASDQYWDDRVRLSPLVGSIEAGKGFYNIFNKPLEGKEITKRDVREASTFLGTLTGIPLARPTRFIQERLDEE